MPERRGRRRTSEVKRQDPRRHRKRDYMNENLQHEWTPKTVHGLSLKEEDELLDRLVAVGHKLSND